MKLTFTNHLKMYVDWVLHQIHLFVYVHSIAFFDYFVFTCCSYVLNLDFWVLSIVNTCQSWQTGQCDHCPFICYSNHYESSNCEHAIRKCLFEFLAFRTSQPADESTCWGNSLIQYKEHCVWEIHWLFLSESLRSFHVIIWLHQPHDLAQQMHLIAIFCLLCLHYLISFKVRHYLANQTFISTNRTHPPHFNATTLGIDYQLQHPLLS